MKRITLFWVSLFILLLFVFPHQGEAQTYQTRNGHAEFTGYTPLFSFDGSSDSLSGSVILSDSAVSFQLPIKSIDTGNNKRNRDMIKTLKAETYQYARFEGKIITPFRSDTSGVQKVKVKGTFKVHGTARELTISGTMQFTENSLNITAEWSQKLTAYDIDPPSVLFYSMKDRQDIRIKAALELSSK
jgi:polyisoprenoid-binding protein YceI